MDTEEDPAQPYSVVDVGDNDGKADFWGSRRGAADVGGGAARMLPASHCEAAATRVTTEGPIVARGGGASGEAC